MGMDFKSVCSEGCVCIYIVRGGTHILIQEDWVVAVSLFCYLSL